MLGANCDNRFRIPVQRSRLAPNIGLEAIHTRSGGPLTQVSEDDV